MDDDGLFGDIEQDNNPSLYQSVDPIHDKLTNGNHQQHQKHDLASPKPQQRGASFDFNNTTMENSVGNDLINSSIGLSQRIRKMLNNPKLIVDVILSERVLNSIVVYLILLKVKSSKDSEAIIVKRRYSEFKSLRDNLVKLFPTLVIPPIPEKHSLLTYLINSIDSARETNVIELRKRYFRNFLQDVIFDSTPKLRNCPLLHKFLDPNYESCWETAINEPPVSLIPSNLLLANPNDTTDQNGLYLLLPSVTGFDTDSPDNLSGLKKLNEDILKLHSDIQLYDLKENNRQEITENEAVFSEIPIDLINFEINFHQNIKVLHDVQKLNSRSVKNFKILIGSLIELGGNLNNFSLQIHDASTDRDKSLSSVIEKFGSAVDSTFLNYEHFLLDKIIPEWDDPVNRFVQYYLSALQLVKYYKYKLIQFKLIYRLKFNKVQEMQTFHDSVNSVKHLKNLDINSPTIKNAIKRIESKQNRGRQLQSKKSWYGLFGGTKTQFNLPELSLNSTNEHTGEGPSDPAKDTIQTPGDLRVQYQQKLQHIDKELNKLDQLIDLVNGDMITLTQNLRVNFQEFLDKMERKWLTIMLEFVRAGKQLFEENLKSWSDFKGSVGEFDD